MSKPTGRLKLFGAVTLLAAVSAGLLYDGLDLFDLPANTTQDQTLSQGTRVPGSTLLAENLPNQADRTDRNEPGAGGFQVEMQRQRVMASLGRRSGNAPQQHDELVMPEWEKIILPGGMLRDDVDEEGMYGSNGLPDFIDLYNGVEAEFIQENISNGVATDMSALLIGRKLSEEVLYNGAVRAEHDLGNGYVLATIGKDNHLRIYAGVERLITDAGTFVEFEFNQNRVRLSSGSPWPIVGERQQGDLLVRMIFSGRVLQSVQVEQWDQGGFRFLDTGRGISGEACMQTPKFMYCVGRPPILHPVDGFEVWDEDNIPLDPVLADDFVEVGIDVDRLAGPQTHFTSVLFRTPEDIAMNSFQVFDRLAYLGMPGVALNSFDSPRN